VAILGSVNLGPWIFLVFYYNFVKRGSFATKFCTHSATDNVNKCCKFGYFTIFAFFCVHILWLNRMSVRIRFSLSVCTHEKVEIIH